MEYVCDHLVIGGGMAGTSIAAELATSDKVILLERESQLGYHTTGRSAAIFLETYGSRIFRLFTHYSRDHYYATLDSKTPLISSRGAMFVARMSGLGKLESLYRDVRELTDSVQWIDSNDLRQRFPCLSGEWLAGVLEPDAMDIDVHSYHQSCIKDLKSLKGIVKTNAEVVSAAKIIGGWQVKTESDAFYCCNIVNAAGAWADNVAGLARLHPLELQPLKRSAVLVETGAALSDLPYIGDVEESFYFKPGADGVMVSPCDETLEEPNDTTANEMDVAVAVDRFERATTATVRKVKGRWAGLRTFSSDRNPVVGFDPETSGFFWLAGQGGYGIQTAPAIAKLGSAMVRNEDLPEFMVQGKIDLTDISPARFRAMKLPNKRNAET